jgi:hypothetical protein
MERYLRLAKIYFVYIQHIIARAFRWSMEFGYLALPSCYKSQNINQQSIYLGSNIHLHLHLHLHLLL